MMMFAIISFMFYCIHSKGFDYPAGMPEPLDAQATYYRHIVPFVKAYETPIQLRYLSALTQMVWNCLAVYHVSAFDSLTKERPVIVADDDTIKMYGNSETRWLCSIYAELILDNYALPDFTNSEKRDELMAILHFDFDQALLEIHEDVKNCGIDDIDCLKDVAEINNYIPEIMGSIVAFQMIEYLENDGWNANGQDANGRDGGCTANCRAFSDPRGKGDKYIPNLKARYSWKPLVEDNGKGFFYHYDHVTPHIGFTGKLKTISIEEAARRSTPKPNYNYRAEIDLAIDRLADLAINDTQKMLVEFFDDKLRVAAAMFWVLDDLLNWSWEEKQLYLVGVIGTEYDSVILAWRDKIIYDRVRPTTLIKEKCNKKILTYAGPYNGLKQIEAKDFEAYHRVMPHAEYPSGSGCICMTRAQFAEKLFRERWNIDNFVYTIPGFPAGSSVIEPGLTPKTDIDPIEMSLEAMYKLCGETRLWGAMHFTDSVPASYELCDGLGYKSYDYVISLLDNKEL